MSERRLFTSESVAAGHPDKVADQISDSILDAILSQDPLGRVACETLVTTGMAVVAGEITTTAKIEYADIVRQCVRSIGYTDPSLGFSADEIAVLVTVGKQSPDIAQGVNESTNQNKEQGAGDQGLMFGYATRETDSLMPMPIHLAHRMMEESNRLRETGKWGWARPDGKCQVTIEYENAVPVRVHTIVCSLQHSDDADQKRIEKAVREDLIPAVMKRENKAHLIDKNTKFYVNPTGRFVVGGPKGDCGLTGRKIIVDSYGGMGRHGGGAFSGKDPTKVDRSACYMARYIAKNVVAAGLANECEVQVAYAIGVAEPVSVLVDTKGTHAISEAKISELVRATFPLTPKGIIEHLNLRRPIYRETARYGHFGRELPNFTWEKTDKAATLRQAAGLEKSSGAKKPAKARA
ncbi:methionine adenosyltransferase [bacterium]|nr:methionine adenosyltransferase [bacterium]